MKNTIYLAAALLAVLFAIGCSEEENYAGGDSASPVVTIYDDSSAKTYQVGFRAVPNTRVETVWILTDPSFYRETFIAKNGEEAYLERVRTEGVKYEGRAAIDYLANPDNNDGKEPGDDLIGYVSTTVLAQGAGRQVIHVIDKNCFSTSLSLAGMMRGSYGDWTPVASVAVTETSLNKQGQTGEMPLLNIPNTDLYMLPALWFFAWEQDFDFQDSGNLIVRMDPDSGAPLGVVSASVMSGFDDQKHGEIGFAYGSSPACTFTRSADDTYTVTGFVLWGEEIAVDGPEGAETPVTMSISWK